MDLKLYLQEQRSRVETAMQELMLTPEGPLAGHIDSMIYSLSAGGKRVRPILCMAAAETLGCAMDQVMEIPCALECIHTYSLIHDDLPAMDDDDLRRGKPTNHMVYGEAGAILAGDGLLTYAFDLLSRPKHEHGLESHEQLRIISVIAQAAGSIGMVGGQALDIDSEDKTIPFETLRTIHACKTGALITASVQSGAILGRADQDQYQALSSYGQSIGLAFQIVDDLLNVEGTAEELGKAVGSDADRNKATYPGFFGVEGTRERAKQAVDEAVEALAAFDHKADPLRELARYIFERTT